MASRTEQQTRWGQPYQQQSFSAPPPPPPPPPVGWLQQSKWRRKLQQQQSTVQPPVMVVLTTARVNVAALAPIVVIGGIGQVPQSKWRRPLQQQQSTVPPPFEISLPTAQVNVAAPAPTVLIFTPPPIQGAYPQARWGQRLQSVPPSVAPPVIVNLTTARVNVAAPAPTIFTTPIAAIGWLPQSKFRRKTQQTPYPAVPGIIAGGSGASGLIKVTYADPTTYVAQYSIAGMASSDSYGNAYVVGYQGPLAATQPGVSNPNVTETWHTLSLTANATPSGNGVNGFFYRYVGDNEVELLWDIELLSTSGTVATFPVGYRPQADINMPSGWYGTGPGAYTAGFSPHWLIRGRTNTVPGQIVMEGFTTLDINMFGRDKFTLDVL